VPSCRNIHLPVPMLARARACLATGAPASTPPWCSLASWPLAHPGDAPPCTSGCSEKQGGSRGSSGHIRLLDCAHNLLQRLPPSLAALSGLATLRLSHNRLTDEGLPWGLLADTCSGSLAVLELEGNALTVRTRRAACACMCEYACACECVCLHA